jgi:hypothetical protein
MCAFTAAEGWGSFSQQSAISNLKSQIAVRWGELRLKTLVLTPAGGLTPQRVSAMLAGQPVPATLAVRGDRCVVGFEPEVTVVAGQTLELKLD